MKTRSLIITSVSVLAIASCVAAPLAFAGEQGTDLEQEVHALKQRVHHLESALGMNGPAVSRQRPQPGSWDPFAEMNRIQEEMNGMFQDNFSSGGPGSPVSGLFSPDTDIQETDHQYIIKLDLPGMEKSNINVEVQGDHLLISGEKKSSSETDDKVNHYFQKERSTGYFSQVLPLPKDIDKNSVNAEYQNGVLLVKVDKLAGTQKPAKKKIQVN